MVLTVNALLVALFDLLVRRDGVHAGWLLPMAAVAMLAAVVAARSLPVVGAVTGAGVWVLVLTVGNARKVPVAALSSLPAQLGFALVAALLGWLLVRAARRGGFAGGLPAG
jgi:hypothetical protein